MTELLTPLPTTAAHGSVVRVHERVERVSPETVEHMRRVTRGSDFLSQRAGLSTELTEDLLIAALLHDMTKTRGKNASVVNKNGSLSLNETISMNSHPVTAFLDINRDPTILGLPEDEVDARAPRIGYLILTHHMSSKAVDHRTHGDYLPANYPGWPTVNEYAERDGYIISEECLTDSELDLARKVLSICDVMDFNITPGGRSYSQRRAPATPEAASDVVADQLFIPDELSSQDLLDLARFMTEARIDDIIAGRLRN